MTPRPDEDDEPILDDDNPEWTEEDFANAVGPDELSVEELAAFPRTRRTRGPQKAPTKRLVALRLDQAVLDHFKAGGAGWQSRINEALRLAMGERRTGP